MLASELIQSRLDGVAEASREPIVDQLDQAPLPQPVLDTGAGFGQTARQLGQRIGVGLMARAGDEAIATHESS